MSVPGMPVNGLRFDAGSEETAIATAGGGNHSLFLLADGSVWSCGDNSFGQLGRVAQTGSISALNLARIADLPEVVAIAAGGDQSLFLLADGTVWSCGNNAGGQLGRAGASGSTASVNLGPVPDLGRVTDFATGGTGGAGHSLFTLADGSVFSCGSNVRGQLGRLAPNGTASGVNLGRIAIDGNVVAVAAGVSHSLLLLDDGTVWACGFNNYGQLGLAKPHGGPSSVNLDRVPLDGVSVIAAGASHSLFLLPGGSAYSCGLNSHGQLGRRATTGNQSYSNLGPVRDLDPVIAMGASGTHSLLLFADGDVWSCGYNSQGQLGRESLNGSDNQVNLELMETIHNVTALSAGNGHSFFLLPDGVYSCGLNSHGQLGRVVESGGNASVNLGRIRLR